MLREERYKRILNDRPGCLSSMGLCCAIVREFEMEPHGRETVACCMVAIRWGSN